MLGPGIDDALNDLKTQLKEKHRGAGNAYRAMVLNWPVDVTTINQPDINRNVDILAYWKHEIAIAYGLPPVVLGDTSATPFKDAPEILAAAYSGAVRSQLVRMEASVNIELMPFFDDSGKFILEFDKEKYEKLGDDLQKNLDLHNKKYETGAITLQTYRQRIGASEDDDNELWEQLPDMVIVPGIAAWFKPLQMT
jgi:phage portal protein BeeE